MQKVPENKSEDKKDLQKEKEALSFFAQQLAKISEELNKWEWQNY